MSTNERTSQELGTPHVESRPVLQELGRTLRDSSQHLRRTVLKTLDRLWHFVGGVSVFTKIMGIVLGLIMLLGGTVTVLVRSTMSDALSHELESRGVAIARDLAAQSTDLVLTDNVFTLHQLLLSTVENNPDLLYAFVLRPDGRVAGHSFAKGVPPDLLAANSLPFGQEVSLQVLNSKVGLIHDVAVPVLEGRAGIARIGLWEQRLRKQLTTTTVQLLLTILIVSAIGLGCGLFLTWVLTRPVKAMVKVAHGVTQGNLSLRAPRWPRDELGTLSGSINAMVDELARALEESKHANSQLLQRHRELAAVAAVARAVSNAQLDLQSTLQRALQVVLDLTGMDAGWIMLLSPDGKAVSTGGCVGIPGEIANLESGFRFPNCECIQAIEARKAVVLPLAFFGCPVRSFKLANGKLPTCHATVPLLTRSRVLGVINILSDDPARFSVADLSLLGAIGRQLGVAIENARLWDELKRREALRGQLLREAITAEEEVRRRIARELHDEIAQSMTSVVVGLKAAEAVLPTQPSRSEEILSGLRASVSQTVKELHHIVYDLRPTLLDDLGLVPALRWYAQSRLEENGIKVSVQVTGQPKRLPTEVETALFRVAQEAMTNIVRHSGAGRVWLTLSFEDATVSLQIKDNGRGFDLSQTLDVRSDRQGFGLLGIRERATLLGGTFELEASPGRGTELYVQVPLREAGE